jgi:hypothetical protein
MKASATNNLMNDVDLTNPPKIPIIIVKMQEPIFDVGPTICVSSTKEGKTQVGSFVVIMQRMQK